MTKVHTREEAKAWFLSHSEGSVIAVDEYGEELEVNNYPDAISHIEKVY